MTSASRKPSRRRRPEKKAGAKNPRNKAVRPDRQRPPVLRPEPVGPDAPHPEGGPVGSAAPRVESGPLGPARVSPALTIARLRANAGGGTRPAQALLNRPFRLRTVQGPGDVLAFSEWFQTQRQQAVGIALTDEAIGFANEEEGWNVPLKEDIPGADIISSAVEQSFKIITSDDPVHLVFQAAAQDLGRLLKLFPSLDRKNLLRAVSGDLQTLQDCIGRYIEQGVFPTPADEAYVAYTAAQHWGTGAPAFYRQVGLPRLCQRVYYDCEATPLSPLGTPWRIAYHDLFLRVLTHYTSDPLLIEAFSGGHDPIAAVGGRLGFSGEKGDEEQVLALIFWAAANFDTAYMEEQFPTLFSFLPKDLGEYKQMLERQLANLCLGVINTRQDYLEQHQLQTLYGRWVLWGLPIGEALMHKWLGTVQDLLDVAEVAVCSFWSDDALEVHPVQEGLLGRVIRIRGVAPEGERMKWQDILEGVSQLSNPLNLPLQPAVIWGD